MNYPGVEFTFSAHHFHASCLCLPCSREHIASHATHSAARPKDNSCCASRQQPTVFIVARRQVDIVGMLFKYVHVHLRSCSERLSHTCHQRDGRAGPNKHDEAAVHRCLPRSPSQIQITQNSPSHSSVVMCECRQLCNHSSVIMYECSCICLDGNWQGRK